MAALQSMVGDVGGLVRILEYVGVALALVAVLAVAFRLVRSTWKVAFGRATLVLPFRGADKIEVYVSGVLAEQLNAIEGHWQGLSGAVRDAQESGVASDAPELVDLGPVVDLSRGHPDRTLTPEQTQIISDEPMEGQAMGPINLGGVNLSPDAIFRALYQLRTVLARRTIRGVVDRFGSTVRLSCTIVSGRGRASTTVLVREVETGTQLFTLVDDAAFAIAKQRLAFQSEARTWTAYSNLLEGYAHQLIYSRTGNVVEREMAIEQYREAVAAEPDYHLARYNLGTLLYNRYTATDNDEAIENLRVASATTRPNLRALTLAQLSRAYCQQVHRYGHPREPWISQAGLASSMAVQLAPAFEETWLAQAFAVQLQGDHQEALAAYQRVVELPGGSSEERRMKSFAENNAGYIYLNHLGDLDEAEVHLRRALQFAGYNKMTFANLGEIHKRRKRYREALEAYRRALELDPRYVNAVNETAMVYVAMAADEPAANRNQRGEWMRSAQEWHERAVALVPEDQHRQRAELHRRFAVAQQENGFAEQSERELAEVAALERLLQEPSPNS
jgi:tetratricopeptide (TPR) repeat protein